MGTVRTYCPTMRGLLVLACFAFFAVANGHQKLVKSEQCQGTMCPAGCCPEQDWFCCPDNMYCAATAADCPFVSMKESSSRWLPRSNVMEPCAQLVAAQNRTGSAALITCIALPQLLTAHLLA